MNLARAAEDNVKAAMFLVEHHRNKNRVDLNFTIKGATTFEAQVITLTKAQTAQLMSLLGTL